MQFTLRDILNTVFRYSRALIIFWAVTIVAVLVFYLQTKKLYDSKARILVTLGSEAQGRAEYLNGKNLQLVQREQQLHDEQQILQSHDVLLTTAKWILGDPEPGAQPPVTKEQLDLATRFYKGVEPEPTLVLKVSSGITKLLKKLGKPQSHTDQLEDIARQLSDGLTVNAIFGSDALDISFRYRDPRVAQTVLSLVIGAYYNHHIAVFQSTAESDLLKSELDRSIEKYHDRLAQFSTYMNDHRLYNDDFQANALVEQRDKIDMAVSQAKADADAAAAKLASLKSLDKSAQRVETYSTTMVPNKYRDTLATKLGEAMVEQQVILTRHPKGSRAYEDQQTEIDELQQLIKSEPEQVVGQTETRRPKVSELAETELLSVTEALRDDEARVQRLTQDRAALDTRIAAYTTNLSGFNSLKLDLAFAKRESEQMGQAYVDSQLRTLTSQNAITDVSVIDAPSFDSHPATPKSAMVAAATLGLLVMGSFAVLFACAGLDTTFADNRALEALLGAPVIASIPEFHAEGTSVSEFIPRFLRENRGEFARICQSIQRSDPESTGGKIILLAESSPQEGASLVGYGIATFLANDLHKKAAYIDCTANSILKSSDIRIDAKHGLSPLSWPKQLDAVGAGSMTPESELTRWRKEYDYILIAGGPLKDAADLLAVSTMVSSAYLLLEAEKTRRATLQYSLDTLHAYGFSNVHSILNKRKFHVPGFLMRFV